MYIVFKKSTQISFYGQFAEILDQCALQKQVHFSVPLYFTLLTLCEGLSQVLFYLNDQLIKKVTTPAARLDNIFEQQQRLKRRIKEERNSIVPQINGRIT